MADVAPGQLSIDSCLLSCTTAHCCAGHRAHRKLGFAATVINRRLRFGRTHAASSRAFRDETGDSLRKMEAGKVERSKSLEVGYFWRPLETIVALCGELCCISCRSSFFLFSFGFLVRYRTSASRLQTFPRKTPMMPNLPCEAQRFVCVCTSTQIA